MARIMTETTLKIVSISYFKYIYDELEFRMYLKRKKSGSGTGKIMTMKKIQKISRWRS